METYNKAMQAMEKLFGQDCVFAMATASKDGKPSVRELDTYWQDGAFYVVTHRKTQKVREIEANPYMSLCREWFRFSGTAVNIGHPRDAANAAIRETLMKVFEPWYLPHNNEDDPHMCFVKITPKSGFFFLDGTGYKVDFAARTAESFPFER